MEIGVDTVVAEMPVGYKQFIEIAREIDRRQTRLLFLDEPTAVLTETEAQILLSALKKLAESGIKIIFILPASFISRIKVGRNEGQNRIRGIVRSQDGISERSRQDNTFQSFPKAHAQNSGFPGIGR